MLIKLLSNVLYFYKKLTTPRDYTIISEELEYKIDYRMKYQVEDSFWDEEKKDWDGILDEFYVSATGRPFRHTIVPQNVKNLVLCIKYWYGGKIYKVITKDINYVPNEQGNDPMNFTIPLSSVWIVDHDDKPQVNITEKVKRYAGPRNDFHGERVPLKDFLYYTTETLKSRYPKIILTNSLGMKKTLLTTEDSTTDLRVP
jgi:hypothetical protein